MPYESVWRAPEIALEYKGITIYHVYDDDEWDNPMSYHFSLDEEEDVNTGSSFDCRDLDVPARDRLETKLPYLDAKSTNGLTQQQIDYRKCQWACYHLKTEGLIRQILREAIDAGIFKTSLEE